MPASGLERYMKRASLAAAFAASLLVGSTTTCIADEARTAEERLLGDADERARFFAYQPFTREIGAAGIVARSLDESLGEAGVPAAALIEARQAFATVIDLGRDVGAGDHFYIRYEQAFTAEGAPIGVGRTIWAELHTKAKGTFAIHRFRPSDGIERLWLADGEGTTPSSMRLPLDNVTVSSGFGWRLDPLDKPMELATAMRFGSAVPEQMSAPRKPMAISASRSKGVRRVAVGSGVASTGQALGRAMIGASRLDLERIAVEREATVSRAFAAQPEKLPSGTRIDPVGMAKPAPRPAKLFMHDGVDLVAPMSTPVYAASDGVVTGAAPNGGYGNWIQLDHRGKVSTVYGHLSSFAPGIEVGKYVTQGELIGFVGNTGRSTGPHLHFEILRNGKAVNPLDYPEIRRERLRGSDFERFRKQVTRALAEREREAAIAALFGGL
jgi:murein DD-endopeptidase MepM/ murein hydrolase activator NlpD